MNFYNEHDKKTAAWLRELIKEGHIPNGVVDERDIQNVHPSELVGFVQCHFFAGIGGWSQALKLAGWPETEPVWTGSCPCQPFSTAGKGLAQSDERHLWPAFFNLIKECKPVTVFGEQVEAAIGHGWLDGISTDLEGEGYAVGAEVLGAHSVGAPHPRKRLYWVANARQEQRGSRTLSQPNSAPSTIWDKAAIFDQRRCATSGMDDASGARRCARESEQCSQSGRSSPAQWLGSPNHSGLEGLGGFVAINDSERWEAAQRHGSAPGFWGYCDIIQCGDGKSRRIESGSQPLANGVPARMVRLRGYGNAIVPQTAAVFIQASIEAINDLNAENL